MKADELRAKLGEAARLQAQVARQETLIQAGAKQRLKAVQQEVERLQRTAPLDADQQQAYLRLVEERGHLWRVLGQSG